MKDYTSISNELFHIGLSSKSIGMYLIIKLMIEQNENVTLEALKNKTRDGMTSIRSSINELIEKEVLERNQIRNQTGGFGGYEYKLKK